MTLQVQTIVVLSTDSLEDLAFKINNWHRSALSLANESLNYAYQCGQALLEAKARVGHGGWLSWRDENFPGISERQTQRYMRVAQEWAAIEAAVSDGPLTIDGALSLIATQRPNPTATSDLKNEEPTDENMVHAEPDERHFSVVGGRSGIKVESNAVRVPLPNPGERQVAHVDDFTVIEILLSGDDTFFVTVFSTINGEEFVDLSKKHVFGFMVADQLLGLSSLNADDLVDLDWHSEPQEPLPGRYHPLHDGEESWMGPNPNTPLYRRSKLSV